MLLRLTKAHFWKFLVLLYKQDKIMALFDDLLSSFLPSYNDDFYFEILASL